MRLSAVLAAMVVAVAPSLQSPQYMGGNAILVNKCDYALNIWSVDQFTPNAAMQTVQPNTNWTEPLRVPGAGCNCGVSIKISKTTTPTHPITQFEYTVSDGVLSASQFISYDISFVDCSTAQPGIAAVDGYSYFTGEDCPAWEAGIQIYGTGDCPVMNCGASTFCPLAAYFEPEPADLLAPSPVRQCPDGDLTSDIVFVACSGSQSTGQSIGQSSGEQASGEQASSKAASSQQQSSTESSASTSPSSSSSSSSSSTSSSIPVLSPSSSGVDPSSVAPSSVAPSGAISSSVSTPAPAITAPPEHINQNQVIVYETVVTTMYVDPEGHRLNADGSLYNGRRMV